MNSFSAGIHSSVWVTYYKPINVNCRYSENNRFAWIIKYFKIKIRLIDNIHNIFFGEHDSSRSPHSILSLSLICTCFINDKLMMLRSKSWLYSLGIFCSLFMLDYQNILFKVQSKSSE